MPYKAMQIMGYRAQVVGAIRSDRTGSEVVLDLTTARAIVEICDQAVLALKKKPKKGKTND